MQVNLVVEESNTSSLQYNSQKTEEISVTRQETQPGGQD